MFKNTVENWFLILVSILGLAGATGIAEPLAIGTKPLTIESRICLVLLCVLLIGLVFVPARSLAGVEEKEDDNGEG